MVTIDAIIDFYRTIFASKVKSPFPDDHIINTHPEDHRATLDNLTRELVIPHPWIMSEREFVLQPLNEYAVKPIYQDSKS